jgi:hypothetical protein
MLPPSAQQSEAMRRHERRLEALKEETLDRLPCVFAEAFAKACHGEPGLDAQGVAELWREERVIGVSTKSGLVFPVFQVDPRSGRLHAVLPRVLGYFDEEEKDSGWPPYLWFTSPRPGIDDRIPAQCLEGAPELVLQAMRFEQSARRG